MSNAREPDDDTTTPSHRPEHDRKRRELRGEPDTVADNDREGAGTTESDTR